MKNSSLKDKKQLLII